MAGKNREDENDYVGLCISSGGYKGFAILGALAALEMDGYLTPKIRKFSGCSVGSVITTLIACGWKPIELYKRAAQVKLFVGMPNINIEKLKEDHGLISNEGLRAELEGLITEKKGFIPTLLEMYNDGYYLSYSICNRLSKREHKIDYKSHPNLIISDGVLMSSNIPIIFPPIHFEGMEVIDGALSNPFPLNYIDNGKDRILGICVYALESNITGFFDYLTSIITIQIEERQRITSNLATPLVDILEMQVSELNFFSGQQTHHVKNAIFFKGYRDGELLVAALKKKAHHERKRLRKERKKSALSSISDPKDSETTESLSDIPPNPELRKPGISDDNLNEKDHKKKMEEVKKEYDRSMKGSVRTPLRQIPESVLLKCLISQPVDLLLQIAAYNPDLLQKGLQQLDAHRLEKFKVWARTIIADEIKTGVHVRVEEKSDRRYDTKDSVKIKENHAKKIYDTLPVHLQATTNAMMKSLPAEKVAQTVHGINVVVEGLKMLGFDVFKGLTLTDASFSFGTERGPERGPKEDGPVIEVMEEEDFGNLNFLEFRKPYTGVD